MTEPADQSQSAVLDAAIRERIIARATAINAKLLERLQTAADDLAVGGYRAALGGLDGMERQIDRMRSFLLLLP